MLKERKKKVNNNGTDSKSIRVKTRVLAATIVVLLIILATSGLLTMFSQDNRIGKSKVSDKESISAMENEDPVQTNEKTISDLEYYKSDKVVDLTEPSFNGKQYLIVNTYNGPVITAEKTVEIIEKNGETETKKNYEGYVVEGTEIEYTITARNAGEVAKTDLLIKDTVPEGLTFVDNSIKVNDVSIGKTEAELAEGIMVDVPAKSGDELGETKLSFRATVDPLEGDSLSLPIKNIAVVDEKEPKKPEVDIEVKKAKIIAGKSAVINGNETKTTVEKDDEITYTIKIENTGEARATINVADTVPAHTQYKADSLEIRTVKNGSETTDTLNFTMEELAAGVDVEVDAKETKKISFTVVVDDIENDQKIKNVATVGDDKPAVEHTYIEPIIDVKKTVTKQDGSEIKNPDYVLEGQKIKYKITVTNTGSKETMATIIDEIPEGLTFVDGSMIVNSETNEEYGAEALKTGIQVNVPAKVETTSDDGEVTVTPGQVVLEFTVEVDELGLDELGQKILTKTIGNIVTVTENDKEHTSEVEVTVNKPDLQVRKTSSFTADEKVKAGDEITYTIELDNSKGTAPTTATVIDTAPRGTTFKDVAKLLNGEAEEETYTEDQLKAGVEVELAAGETKRIVLTVTVGNEENKLVDGEKIRNTANVNGEDTETVENDYVEPIITSKKEVTTENGLDYVVKGEKVTYTITAENAGGLAKEIVIQDTLSDKLTLDEASIVVKVNGEEVSVEKDLANGITITVPEKVDATNGRVEVIFDATVKDDVTGDITNVAIVDGEETKSEDLPIVTFEKTTEIVSNADEELGIPEGKVTVNDEIIYTISVTNSGKAEAQNITVEDSVPAGTKLKENTVSDEGNVVDEKDITWTIDSLQPGETKELSFTVIVTQDKEDTAIENTATVSGKPTNTTTTDVELLSKLTVKYLEMDTNKEILSEEVEILKVGTEYSKEQKDIENYIFVESTDNTEGTIGIDPVEVIFYYVHVSAGVLEEHRDVITDELLASETHAGNEGDSYDIKSREFEGYDLVEDRLPENATGTMTRELTKVVYYYKYRTNVTVKYVDKTTGENIIPEETISGYEGDDYTTERKEFDKYQLVEVPSNADGEMTKEPIEVVYEYLKKQTQVIVHHYEENSTTKVSENVIVPGRIDDEYVAKPATDIPSKFELANAKPYDKDGNEVEPTIIMTEDTIEVIFYYRVKDTSLIIKYLEKGTNEVLADQEQQTGKVEEPYSTGAKTIENYTLVEDTGNTEGILTVEPITVIFYYLQNTKVTVNHIDKYTGETLETIEQKGLVGDEYTSTSKNFEGYILVESPAKEDVIMTKDEIVLNYYYVQISGGVIEKHIDIVSGAILDNASYEGNVGDEYDIKSKVFEGYDLVEDRLPANAKGVMAVRETEVIYYYKHRAKVTVEHLDRNTREPLLPEEIITGHEGDDYETNGKVIDGYVLVVVPENVDGKMTKEDITVTYLYAHTSAGVVERHIDVKTGVQLVPEQKFEGYEGDSYKTEPENIPYYDLVKDRMPENAEGTMTIDQIVVNYYYIKQSNVTVKYVDKATGKEILPEDVIPGHEGDKYTTEEKDIPGYKLVTVPSNKEGTMTSEPIVVIYEYARPAKVVVNYIDVDTNKSIAAEETINGMAGDSYETVAKGIKYYTLVEDRLPANAKGSMRVDVVTDASGNEVVNDTINVNYYYRKLRFNLTVGKEIKNVVVNGTTLAINSDLGKVEIYRKDIATSKVQIIYTIRVTNNGELAGKAELLENFPSGTVMAAANNPEWKVSNTTATLTTEEIKPGESKEYTVVLDWANTENNIGNQKNIVEILSSENEAGFEDINSKDDIDSAELIITVSTGETTYVTIMGATLVILAGLSLMLVKKSKKEQD